MPAVFVLIWSMGFSLTRYGTPDAPLLTFLAKRYALPVCVFAWDCFGLIQIASKQDPVDVSHACPLFSESITVMAMVEPR